MNNRKKALMISIIITIILGLGATYSFFIYNKTSKNISLSSGEIGINFVNDVNYISIDDAYPVSDTIGKIYPYYTDFTITGKANVSSIRYEIHLVPDVDNTLKNEYIKVYLTNQDDNQLAGPMGQDEPRTLLSYDDAKENYGKVIYYDHIEGTETDNGIITNTISRDYRLRIWIDENYKENVQQNFSFKIYLYAYNDDTISNKLGTHILLSESGKSSIESAKSTIEGRTFTVGNIAPMYVNNQIDTANSDLGLYAASDDYGMSYFYRGAVTNNNVKFAGHYWKIVRINGDGSIRLIYNGETSGATGNDTSIRTGASTRTYQFNSMHPDPTYVGYMYGDDLVSQWSEETNYTNLTDTRYVFTKNVPVSNDETRIYTLNGTTKDTDYVIKTPTEMNGDVTIDGVTKKYYEEYTYTCKQTRDASYTDATSTTCQFVIKMTGYNNTTSIKAQYLSYSSTSKDNTRKNNVSSNIKTVLENWYTENILNETDNRGNSYDKYVVDGTFCNDRGTTDSGYLRHEASNYAGYNRLTRATPTPQLTCGSDIRDKFSVTSYRGNAQLTRPIGLLTADELVFAGIKWYNAQTNPSNVSNYLTTNGYWWTMTPAYTFQKNASGFVIIILPAGYLSIYYGVTIGIGARAVINLSPETIIYKGNGTTGSPYEVIME